jgi:hypothetical protein
LGDARRKLILAARLVTFDFTAPHLVMARADREGLGGGTKAVAAGVKILLTQLVSAKYKDGIDRTAGKSWAAWQEFMIEESESGDPIDTVEMPLGQIEWLSKIAKDDSVKIRPEFAQWREALVDYLDLLMRQDNEPGDQESA